MNKKYLKYFYLIFLIIIVLSAFIFIYNKETDLPGSDEEYVHDNGYIFINTSKSIKFVGTEACKNCHKTSHNNFTHTEMYRSFEVLDSTNIVESYPQENPVYDNENGFYYEMLRKDKRFYQREYKLDEEGKIFYERFVEAQYAIGISIMKMECCTSFFKISNG